MNILHVNMSLDPISGGGTVERICQLHGSMRKMSGLSSSILSVAVTDLSALPESKDVVLLPCWNRRWYLPLPKLRTIYRLICRADVIHLMNHWTILNAIVYLITRLAKKPYVISPAGALAIFGRSKGIKRCYNRLVGSAMVCNAAAAIAITEDEVDILIQYGVAAKRIQLIPNGVRLEDFACNDVHLFRKQAGLGNRDYLLFLGRLNEIKGPDLLLEAFIELSSVFLELHLVVAGPDGGMEELLKTRARKAKLADRVHFVGYIGGKLKSSAYHGASLLVVPSRQEAMSIVALEGAVCGVPVVLTDRCGFGALASAGAARLTEADCSAISKVIFELMSDPVLRKEMGAKGQQFVASSYTWDIAAESHLKLFDRCVYRMDS